jgi:lipopolysaccharide export system permease protein
VGAAFSLFSFYINSEVTPPNHEARRRLTAAAGFGSAMDLLEPGRFINDFQNIKIRFDSKTGHWLHNVLIYDYSRPKVVREIRAEKARIEFEQDNLRIELYRVRIDPFHPDKPGAAMADRMTHVIPDALKARNYRQQIKDMRFIPLLNHYRALVRSAAPGITDNQRPAQRSAVLFELHKRFVLSSAPLCFILIGMPLGIRSHRKESTIGVASALGISFCFYILLITAESLARKPQFFLHLVIWTPVAICVALAFVLVRRNQ